MVFIGKKKSMPQVTSMIHELKNKKLNGPEQLKHHIESLAEKKTEEAKNGQNEAKTTEPKKEEQVVEWSQEEQTKLQAAMKQFPQSMEVFERWNKISEAVGGGKTKKNCVDRVKAIKAQLKKK